MGRKKKNRKNNQGEWKRKTKAMNPVIRNQPNDQEEEETLPPLFARNRTSSSSSTATWTWFTGARAGIADTTSKFFALLIQLKIFVEETVGNYGKQVSVAFTNLFKPNNLVAGGLIVAAAVFLSSETQLQRYLSKMFRKFVGRPKNMDFLQISLLLIAAVCVCLLVICLLSMCLSKMFSEQHQFFGEYGFSLSHDRSAHREGRPLEDGACGLENLGNSCYMSSTIQCLSHIPDLSFYFLSESYKQDLNTENPVGSSGEIAKTYSELLHLLWSNRYYSVSPHRFQDIFIEKKPQFERLIQQDAQSQEFLSALLDALHEDMNKCRGIRNGYSSSTMTQPDDDRESRHRQRSNTKQLLTRIDTMSQQAWKEHSKVSRSVISDKFYGQLCCKTRCPECEHNSVKFDSFSVLTLPLPEPAYILRQRVILPLSSEVEESRQLDIFLKLRMEDSLSKCQRLLSSICGLNDSYTLDTWVIEQGIPQEIVDPRSDMKLCSKHQSKLIHQIRPKAGVKAMAQVIQRVYTSVKSKRESGETVFDGDYMYTGLPFMFFPRETTKASDAFKVAEMYARLVWSSHSKRNNLPLSYEDVTPEITFRKHPYARDTLSLRGDEKLLSKDARSGQLVSKLPFVVITWGLDLATYTTEDYAQISKDQKTEAIISPSLERMQFSPLADLVMHDPEKADDYAVSFSCEDVLERKGEAESYDRPGVRIRDWFLTELDLFQKNKYGPREVTSASLGSCLENFQSEEELSSDNKYTCEYCRLRVMARRSLLLWETPDVLIILLKRFIYVDDYGTISKDNMLVTFPLKDLDLNDWVKGGADQRLRAAREQSNQTPPKPSSAKYDLCGVVMHSGSLTGGHYTAYVENPLSNSWHFYNDQHVHRVAIPTETSSSVDAPPTGDHFEEQPAGVDLEKLESLLHSTSAYVLVYRRQGSLSGDTEKLRQLLKKDSERPLSQHPALTGVM